MLFVTTDKPKLQTDCGGQGGESEGAEGPGHQAAGPQQVTGKNNFFFISFRASNTVSFILTPNTAALASRNPASSATCRDSCCTQGHNKRDT